MTDDRLEQSTEQEQKGDSPAALPRRLAEWVSLGVSALLILGVCAYLVREGTKGSSEIAPITVGAVVDEVRSVNSRFIVPIKVTNGGEQTVHKFTGSITLAPKSDQPDTTEFEIDYLAEKSSETIYVYLDRDPREGDFEIKALSYQVE